MLFLFLGAKLGRKKAQNNYFPLFRFHSLRHPPHIDDKKKEPLSKMSQLG